MAWHPMAPAVTPTAGAMTTVNNPPATPVPPNSRSWSPAIATARQPTQAVPMAAATGSEVALRGDHRTPAQIDAAGGLFSHHLGNHALPTTPNLARAAGPQPGGHRGPSLPTDYTNNPYHPDNHQAFGNPSKLVSCTRDIRVAKGFAGANGHVYLVRVNKGVDYNAYRAGNALQAEVMALQGIALRDIIAARSMATNAILINSNFQQANMTQAAFNAAIQLLMS
ncbi:MAG TPA: hypothetical protein VNQ78_09615 [Paracoccus sp. (in: a-proteobacteria)]|uniref:hypothetical protein n=1 Tax=Paracoccus sp. TaxID=267 RepID=UPI002C01B40D|nr:hypothetical protein [Paracoccus sp. (in: a-proteobacteria)]HWL56915.1 hypothetical protein [Paracoccus sp. (in: a-proteobacteria)]